MKSLVSQSPGNLSPARTTAWDTDITQICHTRVSEILRRSPVWVEPEMPLDHARDILLEYGLRAVPVVDRDKKPIGMVSLRDLVRALLQPRDVMDSAYSPQVEDCWEIAGSLPGFGFHVEQPTAGNVADVMMHMVFQLPITTSIGRVAGLMSCEGVSQIAIVGSDGKLLGMVTGDDIARWFADKTGYWPRKHWWYSSPVDTLEVSDPDLASACNEMTEKKTVLIVEDDTAINTCMVEILEDEGYAGLKALNGRQALQVLKGASAPPGLIILDLMMPEMNGWEFRRAQLEDPKLRSIPVIVLTAYGTQDTPAELKSPACFLRKPVGVEMLLDTVAKHYPTGDPSRTVAIPGAECA